MYLDMLHGKEKVDSDDNDDDDDEVVVHDLKQREDFSKYVSEKDLHVLDDPRESPSRRGTVLSRVKKARQRAIRNQVEKNMTADDRLKEQMAANQMLSRSTSSLHLINKSLFHLHYHLQGVHIDERESGHVWGNKF